MPAFPDPKSSSGSVLMVHISDDRHRSILMLMGKGTKIMCGLMGGGWGVGVGR